MSEPIKYPMTPDGRYFIVRGRLWRLSDPTLAEEVREKLIRDLMLARRAIANAHRRADPAAELAARKAIGETKVALGERGPVWWSDGTPDLNRRLVRSTPYAEWYAAQAAHDEPIFPPLVKDIRDGKSP